MTPEQRRRAVEVMADAAWEAWCDSNYEDDGDGRDDEGGGEWMI